MSYKTIPLHAEIPYSLAESLYQLSEDSGLSFNQVLTLCLMGQTWQLEQYIQCQQSSQYPSS